MSSRVYIVDGVRTPVGRFGKSLRDVPAARLAAFTIRKLLERVSLEPSQVDFVIMGHVIRAGTGLNTARQAALQAGIPKEVDAMTVDMVCASGMAAIVTGAQYIKTGEYDLVVAGGMESMSQAPFVLDARSRWGIRHLIGRRMELVDAMVHDGLWDATLNKIMGEEADMTARHFGAPREELDWIAYESHMRAARAWDNGWMSRFVEPYEDNGRVLLEADEGIRRDTNLEKLSKLPHVFTPEGPHTAGTSSQISDGAAALLIASEDAVREIGLKPIAEIKGFVFTAVDTWMFPYAPVEAIKKLLAKIGWRIDDVDYWENNEAFAVNNWLAHRFLGIPYEKMNVHGGAIAVGHPLGMSGARITLELINVLLTHGGKRGVAAICHGLGGAAALALEIV
jgi:acetyl-CoA C-acetyltransferase